CRVTGEWLAAASHVAASNGIQCGVERDPVEPRAGARRTREGRHGPPQLQQNVLVQILACVRPVRIEPADPADARVVLMYELEIFAFPVGHWARREDPAPASCGCHRKDRSCGAGVSYTWSDPGRVSTRPGTARSPSRGPGRGTRATPGSWPSRSAGRRARPASRA